MSACRSRRPSPGQASVQLFRLYHDAAFHMHMLFSPAEHNLAVVVESAGIFGNESEGSAFAVFGERRRLQSERRDREHMRLSTFVEIEQSNLDRFALAHIKRRVSLPVDVAAATKKGMTEMSRCKIRLAISSNFGPADEDERASGRL